MQHGVAVRTNRTKVLGRINSILFANVRELPHMMNMDESVSYRSVLRFERKFANTTLAAVLVYTLEASVGIADINLSNSGLNRSFSQSHVLLEHFGGS